MNSRRSNWVMIVLQLGLVLIVLRLFFWQVIKSDQLKAVAQNQYNQQQQLSGQRGRIFAADGHLLVGNLVEYRLIGQPHLFSGRPDEVVDRLTEQLGSLLAEQLPASAGGQLSTDQAWRDRAQRELSREGARWVPLLDGLSSADRDRLAALNMSGITFESYSVRSYPEASMAAQVLGFLGNNDQGRPTGYFGVEGALDRELSGESQTVKRSILNVAELVTQSRLADQLNGRDVTLTIRRDVQRLLESKLAAGIDRYGAAAGEAIVLEPATGRILGMATLPGYHPAEYQQTDPELFGNTAVSDLYEPGSTFKVLTLAAGLDSQLLTPDTKCRRCDAPRVIDKYTIRTWNDVYHPGITMTEALAKSDNTAMIFAVEEMGAQTFAEYLRRFRIGQEVLADIQEDSDTPLPKSFGPVELATASFGQGIATTSLQMVRAFAAIANGGLMVQPKLVDSVSEYGSSRGRQTPVVELGRVISTQTADQLTAMMVNAAQYGEAQWTAADTYLVAGKTGTSQVAVEGGYDSDRTITSFIGFTPPQQPAFLLFVKLNEPQSSPWAAETAAPLWYRIADDLRLLLDAPPE
ncbi:MAG: hypothetical protein COU69_01805 [Candidatus Pacebacteria bacterium CG10_big_fil_rev_8_21_14_0_10_56_10]|nr:MAG: hypothetical protein COU69_01805 [Candidatus Pacebacteria bacterium CG10_big_fil_rev_8_21_14_0_10_56_10]